MCDKQDLSVSCNTPEVTYHSLAHQDWDAFVRSTLTHAQHRVRVWNDIPADVRAEYALTNSDEYQQYQHWRKLISEYQEDGLQRYNPRK